MFGNVMNIKNIIVIAGVCAAMSALTACDKVSPQGVLMAGTGVNDRVRMSINYYTDTFDKKGDLYATESEYSFLVAADSHVTTDTMRMHEMFSIAMENNDLFVAHLGDIADTKPEYYSLLKQVVNNYNETYFQTRIKPMFVCDPETRMYYDPYLPIIKYTESELRQEMQINPFFPVVGNHDITHNGWALWSDIFKSSFYEFNIIVGDTGRKDHFIFLDTASGTLGNVQIDAIDEGLLDFYLGDVLEEDDDEEGFDNTPRHTFLFSHTNLFRPNTIQFASTFPREEMYYLLDRLHKWDVTAMFCGHVHAWDDRVIGGVRYITLDSMSERNSPEPGDYLVRVNVHADGTWDIERVHMNYTTKNKSAAS